MDRTAALSDFDAARGEWEAAFALVPDAALGHLKPGDDYSLGGLQVHVNWVLLHYSRILEAIVRSGFAEVAPQDAPGEADAAARRAGEGMTGAARATELAKMERLHRSVASVAARVDAENWSRTAPVIYAPGQDPYPTSAADVLQWLRDHYREHVDQCGELVDGWIASASSQAPGVA